MNLLWMIRWEYINNGCVDTAIDEISDLGHVKLLAVDIADDDDDGNAATAVQQQQQKSAPSKGLGSLGR